MDYWSYGLLGVVGCRSYGSSEYRYTPIISSGGLVNIRYQITFPHHSPRVCYSDDMPDFLPGFTLYPTMITLNCLLCM